MSTDEKPKGKIRRYVEKSNRQSAKREISQEVNKDELDTIISPTNNDLAD